LFSHFISRETPMQALRDMLECERVSYERAAPRAANQPLAALADASFAQRFRHWRGESGRRYIFSVYDPFACPSYDNAVLIAAARDENGEARVVFVADTGALPEIVLARAKEEIAAFSAVEFHIHLLAASRAERAALMEDLAPSEAW
jgi:hypothetical protein